MKLYVGLTVAGLSLMTIFLSACAGLPSAAPRPAFIEPTTAGTPIVSHGGPVVDYVSLVDALRTAGATVEPVGEIKQDFFSPTGQAIKVNGADVQVFEFPAAGAADAEAAKVAPDGGSMGTIMVTWVDAPHFYRIGKIIVLYVGSEPTLTGALQSALGPQFAGR